MTAQRVIFPYGLCLVCCMYFSFWHVPFIWWAEMYVFKSGLEVGPPLKFNYNFYNILNLIIISQKLNQSYTLKIPLPHELKVGPFDFDFWHLTLTLTLTFWNFMRWVQHALPHHPWFSAWLPCQNLTYFDFGNFLKFFQLFIFLNFFFIFATVTWKIAFWGTLSHFLTPKVGSRRMLGL